MSDLNFLEITQDYDFDNMSKSRSPDIIKHTLRIYDVKHLFNAI